MSIEDDLRDLARIPLFATLEFEARRQIVFAGETRILRYDDILFRQGERSDAGYLLLNGRLEIEAGRGVRGQKVISPPSLIGEMALLTETERPVTILARAPSTVLKISRLLFHRVLKENPRSAAQVRSLVELRLRAYSQELEATRRNNFSDVVTE